MIVETGGGDDPAPHRRAAEPALDGAGDPQNPQTSATNGAKYPWYKDPEFLQRQAERRRDGARNSGGE
jgi:hypothetical protein